MAGVFINYRSADNPYGPAAIHDGLVRQFGEARVFRDCVSMGAGTIYPAAIRAALATADVVVAVIGPRWLTATDKTTGARLIDRPHDWVRRELSWAFANGTHVVPVLLKDTPAHASQPHAEDLPDDIRSLAFVQAFRFSQRTFGADLDRLATALRDLVPALGPAPPPVADSTEYVALSGGPFYEVVDALCEVPCMRDDSARSLVVDGLPTDIAFGIRTFAEARAHITEILRKSLEYDDGLGRLLSAIQAVDGGGDSPAWRHLVLTVQRRFSGLAS